MSIHPSVKLAVLAALLGANVASADVGVMLDAGVPDGAVASVVLRPTNALRLHGGIGHNAMAIGARVGATLVPLKRWISPTLSIDYGHYPEGVVPMMADLRVGYDYANAHAGVVFGRVRGSFYLQAGMSRTTATIHDDATRANVVMWSPSARLGFVLYL